MTVTWKIPHASGAELWGWTHDSHMLAQSPAGFSAQRPHVAFVPPQGKSAKLPVLYALASWLGAGRSMMQWEAFREDLPTRLMRLIETKMIPPCVVVCPDLFIDYGGSQFIDSDWVGPHASYIGQELIPWVEDHLPVLKGKSHRGVFGRSSGGFGAIRFATDSELFHSVGCHAGDMGFEWVYRRSLVDLCTGLVKYANPQDFIAALRQQKKLSGWDTHILMMLGMCAFYSPNRHLPWGFDLPIDLKTAEIHEQVWSRWLAHDPVERLKDSSVVDRLGSLGQLYIDCGNRDQYFLQYGSRRLTKILKQAAVKHSYAEFDDNHSGTSYRYDESLPKLLSVLI